MKIYIAHSTGFDFKQELYQPIRSIDLTNVEFILPHEFSDKQYNSKELFNSGEVGVIIADVSFPSTGLGIELGWASYLEIPIVCIYKSGSKVSGSISVISSRILEYSNEDELVKTIKNLKEFNQ